VIVSRPSLDEARIFIRPNGWQEAARVFESSNGWYAITTWVISLDDSEGAIGRLKRSAAIPPDSYCSPREAYLREIVWHLNDEEVKQPASRVL